MFNSVAFEVVIGLVFVYLLYSLFITILGELIVTKLDVRARLLRHAIDRMLNDGYYKCVAKKVAASQDEVVKQAAPENKDVAQQQKEDVLERITESYWDKLLIREPKLFKASLAGKFYEQPTIKYLSKLDSKKPSYFSADNFGETVISLLKDVALRNTELNTGKTVKATEDTYDTISAILYAEKTPEMQKDTKNHLINIWQSSKKTLPDEITVDKPATVAEFKVRLMKWFNETMDRANGWFKEKLRLILFFLGFIIAACFNVDSIKIGQLLATDKDARAQLVSMGIAFAKDSAKFKPYLNKDGDTVHSQTIIDSAYSHINKDISSANKVLGLGWNFDDKLKSDDFVISTETKGLFAKAEKNGNYDNEKQAIKNYLNAKNKSAFVGTNATGVHNRIDSVNLQQEILNKDSIIGSYSMPESAIAMKILAGQSILLKALKEKLAGTQKMWAYLGHLSADSLSSYKLEADKITDNKFVFIDSASKDGATVYGRRHYSYLELFPVFITRMFSISFFGFVITAFALSLGAPFWFDLLSKLVSIRGAGIKPEEKK
jgi:hypothetical protein